jgi:transposase
MNNTIISRPRQVLVWFFWFFAILAWFWQMPIGNRVFSGAEWPAVAGPTDPAALLAGVVTQDPRAGALFPWGPKRRWRKWALIRYQAWQRAVRKARFAARVARLAVRGAVSIARVVDLLTSAQIHRHLGALPALYSLLEILQVRQIINRHVPTQAQVDYGMVALVLIMNRLSAPRPLYHVADWLAQTVLVYTLHVPVEKFNDDRLARTLSAIGPHARDIWQDIVGVALLRFDIDVSLLFYDLSAFVVQGEYKGSHLAKFGFAHNTPMGKRKIKTSLDVSADGDVPLDYAPWSGDTADTATVQTNLERLSALLDKRGCSRTGTTLLVGDRANLNDELALAFDKKAKIRYLAGLEPRKKEHRALLQYPEAYFLRQPLAPGYWGMPCQVHFEHADQQATHRGLVVISGPMRTALRLSRAAHFRALRQVVETLQQKIGRPHYRSEASVLQHAKTCLRNSPVGKLSVVWTTATEGQVLLHWMVDREALQKEMLLDGRYLLVTNDFSLTPVQMLAAYRKKDGVEKCFRICKSDLLVSPIFLHKDVRIEGMLLINMLALLTYRLLERQLRKEGLHLTLRHLIYQLESLSITETYFRDGSLMQRLTPVNEEQRLLLLVLTKILKELRWPGLRLALPTQPLRCSLPDALPDNLLALPFIVPV